MGEREFHESSVQQSTGFDADKVTENSEDSRSILVNTQYDLYSDTDSLIDAYKEGYNLTNDNG